MEGSVSVGDVNQNMTTIAIIALSILLITSPPFFKQNRKAEHTVVSSFGSSALLPCVSSLGPWKAWFYRDLNVTFHLYFEHFSCQAFPIIISPQSYFVSLNITILPN